MYKARSLVESITRCFDDETYSDLIIKCGDRSWKVHRVVVCSQSKVLHAACMTGFKVEAQTGVIDLDDDDPAAVEIMLKFFYTGEYNDVANQSGELSFEMRIQVLTYNLADKFDVPALMKLAERRFQLSLNLGLTEEDYVCMISNIYTLPTPTNALKSMLVEYARLHFREILQGPKSDLLQASVRNIPEFALDVLMVFIDAPLRGRCFSCGPNQTAEAIQARCVKCGKGGISLTH